MSGRPDRQEEDVGSDMGARLAAQRIAVLVPCYNEEATVGDVVAAFRRALPLAQVHVYDNNSSDRTVEVARAAGAVVGRESQQGKGSVVRRMFADVEAEIYVLVDGDATYDASSAPAMIARLVDRRLDMVVGTREEQVQESYRRGHRTGNRLLTRAVSVVFGQTITDMLSGYRVLSRRFVKSFPALSSGFEVETELTVHALEIGIPMAEMPAPYYARPAGSASKLNTWRDGLRILWTIGLLYRSERPLQFFSVIAGLLAALAVVLAIPVIATFVAEGIVPRLPTAILSTGLMLAALLCLAVGLVLDTVTRGRREMKRLAYLQHLAPGLRPEPPAL